MLTNLKVALVLNTTWNIYNFRMGILKTFVAKGAEVIVIAPSKWWRTGSPSWSCVARSKAGLESRSGGPNGKGVPTPVFRAAWEALATHGDGSIGSISSTLLQTTS